LAGLLPTIGTLMAEYETPSTKRENG